MYERFTDRARKVMQLANQEAQRFNHEYIGTEHMSARPRDQGRQRRGRQCSEKLGCRSSPDSASKWRSLFKVDPEMVTMGKLPQTPRAKKVIEYSMEEARNLNHNYVGTEHILLGLLRETRRRRGPSAR